MAATAQVIWLCACERYRPGRGLMYVCPLLYVCPSKRAFEKYNLGDLFSEFYGISSRISIFWNPRFSKLGLTIIRTKLVLPLVVRKIA